MENKQQFIEDNIPLVYHIIAKEYPTYRYDEDIIQSGMVGLCKAVENWDENKSKFSTYAGRCIRNEIYKEFLYRKPHSKNISLDSNVSEDCTLGDLTAGEHDIEFVDNSFYLSLTDDERQVMRLNNSGYSTDEIADITNFNNQKVRKILRNIRLKWRKADGQD